VVPSARGPWAWLAWPAALVLATPILVTEAVERRRRNSQRALGTDAAHTAALLDHLAGAVRQQWRAEAAARLLNRPEPIRLRWAATHRSVTLVDPAASGAGGDVAEIAETLLALRTRQLVVLGEPGAGKSVLAMVLTLDLLDRRRAGTAMPVPVLLSVSSWQPREEPLWTWVARRLAEDYPALTGRSHPALEELVVGGALLPVLDGLDEIPAELHAAAIEAVDQATAGGVPFLLTCRAEEYERAVAAGGRALSAAAVVEVLPVDLTAAASYLAQSGPSAAARWQPVLAGLRDDPQAPLSRALTTPLAVWLARTVYTDPRTDPAELTDRARFPDAGSIESHLLDAYLPAVYVPRTGEPDPHRAYRPDQVRRWLGRIASELNGRRTYDLAWWTLFTRTRVPVVFAFLAGAYTFILGVWANTLISVTGDLAGGTLSRAISSADMVVLLALGIGATALAVRLNQRARSGLAGGGRPHRWGRWRWVDRIASGVAAGIVWMAGFIVAAISKGVGGPEDVLFLGIHGLGIGVGAGLANALAVAYRASRRTTGVRAAVRERLATAGVTGLPVGVLYGLDQGAYDFMQVDLLLSGGVALATAIAILAVYGPLARLFAGPGIPHRLTMRISGRGRHVRRLLLAGAAYGPAIGVEVVGVLLAMTGTLKFVGSGGHVPSLADLADRYWSSVAALAAAGAVVGLVIGILVGLCRALFDPADAVQATSPDRLLRQDRASALLAAALIASSTVLVMLLLPLLVYAWRSTGSLGLGAEVWTVAALLYGLPGVLIASSIVALRFPWAAFVVTRWRLALTGRLPLRLMTFLADAWRRGVLRQAGGVYQFRHAHLQDHLALDVGSRSPARGQPLVQSQLS
jgi:NACHT domain